MLEIVRFLLSTKECSNVEIVLFSAVTKLSGLEIVPKRVSALLVDLQGRMTLYVCPLLRVNVARGVVYRQKKKKKTIHNTPLFNPLRSPIIPG